MDVKCTSTGKIFYRIDSAIAGLLCEALPSVFEPVNSAAPQPTGFQGHNPAVGTYVHKVPEPKWNVVQLPVSGRFAISLEHLSSVNYYDGDPDQLTEKTFGRAVPEHILAKYREVWRSPEQ